MSLQPAQEIRNIWGEIARIKRRLSGSTGSAVTEFTDLTDEPGSYVGEAGKFVNVNAAETALEFDDLLDADIPSTLTGKSYQSNKQQAFQLGPYGVAAGNTGEIRFLELAAGGVHYVGFKAPDAIAASKVFTLPDDDGAPLDFLQTDGALTLSWAAGGGGGGGDVFGPAGATDEAVARFDTATGKLLQNSNLLLDNTGLLLLASAGNSKMTIGLTVDQGANDNNVFAGQSSDIAHGCTTVADTNTYVAIGKNSATLGGSLIQGFGETTWANVLQAYYTADTSTKGTTALAPFLFVARKISGTGFGNMGANANVAAIRAYKGGGDSTVWHVDEDGDVWHEGYLGLDLATSPLYHIHVKSNASAGLFLEADADNVTETDVPFIYMSGDGGGTTMIIGQAPGDNADPLGVGVSFVQANALLISKRNAGSYMHFAVDNTAFLSLYGHTVNKDWQVTIGTEFNVAGTEFLNANMKIGLNINQGGEDDELLALKSSNDVAHGCTDNAETDTFGCWSKVGATSGGLRSRGFSETQYPFQFMGYATTMDTTKTTAGRALFESTSYKISGAGTTDVDADANIFAVRCARNAGVETVVIIDEDGDIYYDGALQNYDHLDDALACRDAQNILTGNLHNFIKYNEASLIDIGIIGGPLEKGGMVSHKRMTALMLGAIAQINEKAQALDSQIQALSERIN